ncbi:glycosyltransferase family 4 protein [Priestia aryabhattai]|uniref:glycosyltransferase family 4 protein n=1 Tax=Priestia aryabhattai TaxID=412384 RepID=UPI0030CA9D45
MKIAFYLDNKNSKDIDYSQPYMGNPGVGGTQFMISLLSWYYAQKYKNNNIILYAPYVDFLPNETNNVQANSLIEAYAQADEDKADFFICRSTKEVSFFNHINKGKTKVILWGHNFATFKELNLIAKSKTVAQYICVSKEQLKLIQGHKAFHKSSYIYNAIPTDIYPENNDTRNDRSICYLGSIVPSKGFDVTAKLWRHLYDRGIKVKLHVIGSGQLYNKSAELGEYGIAQQEFENQFIKYLIDDKGNMLDDVIFHGLLKFKEKTDVMADMTIGIINPTGETETFGISAIEFQALNIPVITCNRGGLKNTVMDGNTGYLSNSFEELVEKTEKLLDLYSNNPDKYFAMAQNARSFILNNFDINLSIEVWNELLTGLYRNEKIRKDLPKVSTIQKVKNYFNLFFYIQ